MSSISIVGVVGSAGDGNTNTLVEEVLGGAREHGATTLTFGLGRGGYLAEEGRAAIAAIADADAVVLGTPMYRSSFSGVLKQFLDELPRAQPVDGFASPLLRKTVAVVGTGGSDHHYLGIDALIGLLPRFFAAYVVPPGLYGRADQLLGGTVTDPELRGAARTLGAATVALASAVAADERLAVARPQF